MSCNCCDNVTVIQVSTVTTSATNTELNTTTVLATTLVGNKKVILVLDPSTLPANVLPVVLTDGTTTIPLTMENGNNMRENIFQPYCMSHACCGRTELKSFYGAEPAHLLVFFW